MNNFQGVTDTFKKKINKLNTAIAPELSYYCLTEYENIEKKVKCILRQPQQKWKVVDVKEASKELSDFGVRVKIEKEVN